MSKSNGKLFGKINILDLIIGLIILILICGAVYKFTFVDNTVYIPDYDEGYITVYATGLKVMEKEALTVGDPFAVPKIQKLGVITDIKFGNSNDNRASIDGNVYPVPNPLLFDAVITIHCEEMTKRDVIHYVGRNYVIMPGQTLDVTNGLVEFKADVLSVSLAD